jgi:protein-S-isoprenylcysteine O-methyltransferase Ste14
MRIVPPVIALLCLVVGGALQWLLPDLRFTFPGKELLGLLLAAAGIASAVWAARTFSRRDTTISPHGTPTALVAEGPFRYTRNPMYLGMLLFLLGVAVGFGGLALLAAPIAFFAIISLTQIPTEEARMLSIFGDEYTAYRTRVRRWL